jgi:uncharacterized protein with NAD-binding domain and iron-sulfur cluster
VTKAGASRPGAASSPSPRRAVVVGGGLAGMVAALRLAEHGTEVALYEAGDRLGGKAGSTPGPAGASDHGYHVFPAWYHNLWRLVDELGIRNHFVPLRDFYRLRKGETEFHKAILWPRTLLSAVDLLSRRARYLEELSLSGFLRSRWYNGLETGRELRDLLLKAAGNPAWDVSSLTIRNNMRLWMRTMLKHNWTAADGSLQERFIQPVADAVEAVGVEVRLGARVTAVEVAGSGAATTVTTLEVGGLGPVEVEGVPVVFAVPHATLRELLLARFTDLPDSLQSLSYLRSQPLAAFDVHLTRRLEGLPPGHFILEGSRHHLTGIDIRPLWEGLAADPGGPSVLQLIAADTHTLDGVDDEEAQQRLLEDVLAFFPTLTPDDVTRVVLHRNQDAPLFMNDVGTDRRRPPSDRAHGTNLFVAGDWCSTPIDLACMEGAVVSGTQAARAVVGEAWQRLDDPRLPATRPSALAWVARVVASPFAWLFGLPVDFVRWLRRVRQPDPLDAGRR